MVSGFPVAEMRGTGAAHWTFRFFSVSPWIRAEAFSTRRSLRRFSVGRSSQLQLPGSCRAGPRGRLSALWRGCGRTGAVGARERLVESSEAQGNAKLLSAEERRALLASLAVRLDESFRSPSSAWLPLTAQRGGGRSALRGSAPPREHRKAAAARRGFDESETAPLPLSKSDEPTAAIPRTAFPPPAVRAPEDLSAQEAFFVFLRQCRTPSDWKKALRCLQLLHNFGRVVYSFELSDRLCAAACLCGKENEALTVRLLLKGFKGEAFVLPSKRGRSGDTRLRRVFAAALRTRPLLPEQPASPSADLLLHGGCLRGWQHPGGSASLQGLA